MSVNGITGRSSSDAYNVNATYNDKKTKETANAESTSAKDTTSSTAKSESAAVVYEKSAADTTATTTNTKEKNAAIIAQLKADQEKNAQQLQDIVTQTLSKQTNTYGQANNIWQFLAKGNYTVDAATQAQAQKDIAEDGYWGVEATSDRIIDFAKALSGNDPTKIATLKEAFEKGYKLAEKTWGGKLPDISQRTYDAVFEKFDAWEKEANASNTITIQENEDSTSKENAAAQSNAAQSTIPADDPSQILS